MIALPRGKRGFHDQKTLFFALRKRLHAVIDQRVHGFIERRKQRRLPVEAIRHRTSIQLPVLGKYLLSHEFQRAEIARLSRLVEFMRELVHADNARAVLFPQIGEHEALSRADAAADFEHHQCASSQDAPMCASTSSSTRSSAACRMVSFKSSKTRGASASAASTKSSS